MTSLLTLLGALLCSVTISAEVLPQPNFKIQELAGKWYVIGYATNVQSYITKDKLKMGTAKFTPSKSGDVDIETGVLKADGSCMKNTHVAKKTKVSGQFTYSTGWDNMNDMRIVDLKTDEYILVHILRAKGNEKVVVNKLFGRGQDLSTDVLEKFWFFSLQTGIHPENVIFLRKTPECPPA